MHVLVLGVGGFIGSHLVDRPLRGTNHAVEGFDCIERIVANPGGVCDRQIFNVGNPENEIAIRDLAHRMRDIYAKKFLINKPGGRLPEIVDVDSRVFYGEGYEDSDRRIPDVTKARTLLGWRPKYGLDEVIEKSMAGYASYAEIPAPGR